ncbi:MAG: hypothetical protein VX780_09285 [Pseudomonadota bacterium]|nr:hypothetical protein [Pseudomonadota bacterium]
MKRILPALVFVVLLFPSFALGETMANLVIKDGLYYKKLADIPFTKPVTGRIQGSIENGKFIYKQKIILTATAKKSALEKAQEVCAEIGFKKGTEKFNDCVVQFLNCFSNAVNYF